MKGEPMSHQPFENWLFSDEPIEPEQSKALKSHLEQCKQCNQLSIALGRVTESISTSSTPLPNPGFTARWYQRLSEYRQKQQERRIWLAILGLLTLASLILLGLFFINLTNFNFSFGVGQFVANISLIAVRIKRLLHIVRSITNAFPAIVPIMFIFGVGSLSAIFALMVTWFSTIIRLYQPVEERG
jgi:hypothetical protein